MQRSLLKQIIEGAILAADTPLSVDRIMSLLEGDDVDSEGVGVPARSDVREVLSEIAEDCAERGFELKKVATGYRFQVRTELGEWVGKLWEERPPRYTRALLETLALIAYKQPITRGDIEEIRGVAVSTNIIRTLLDREWIRVVGQRDVPGKPSLFATTREFLDYFNLTSLDELPTLTEIRDLDAVNQQLDLEEELMPPRTLAVSDRKQMEGEENEGGESRGDDLGESLGDGEDLSQTRYETDGEESRSIDSVDLDEVTDRVNQIQDNIRRLYERPDETQDDYLDAEDVGWEVDTVQSEVTQNASPEGGVAESGENDKSDVSGPVDPGEESAVDEELDGSMTLDAARTSGDTSRGPDIDQDDGDSDEGDTNEVRTPRG
ncbi:MAG: SMC-Scp complex subunit ScpB [Gammaproteobacteria bacterium]|nr:SMC-Scp complex subunit ScpB [Gammaproteobacteria bacterium]OUU07019.1 MAG: SMC-Scp complex subunit ScpB [Gammaproteobacteria bacterium TMED34]